MFERTDKKPFTADQWQSLYSSLGKDPTLLLGYMDCASISASELFRILETAKNFEDLKEQVLGFAQGQVNLINTIDDVWYGDDPEKYDLPSFSGPC